MASIADIRVVNYSEKSVALYGEGTKEIKDKLLELGGKYNPALKEGKGWIFQKKKKEALIKLIAEQVHLAKTVSKSSDLPSSKKEAPSKKEDVSKKEAPSDSFEKVRPLVEEMSKKLKMATVVETFANLSKENLFTLLEDLQADLNSLTKIIGK